MWPPVYKPKGLGGECIFIFHTCSSGWALDDRTRVERRALCICFNVENNKQTGGKHFRSMYDLSYLHTQSARLIAFSRQFFTPGENQIKQNNVIANLITLRDVCSK